MNAKIHTSKNVNAANAAATILPWPFREASIALCLLLLTCSSLTADEWMTWASTYTHEPRLGQRIDQYALPEQPIAQVRPDFQRSGFRHYRSTLQAGSSADNFHVVEQWGRQIVPYEQWRFPFRPYAVPYDAWGPPPNNIFASPYGFPVPGGVPGSLGGVAVPGAGFGPGYGTLPLQPTYNNQPWYDGTHPDAAPLDTRTDAEFFQQPTLP